MRKECSPVKRNGMPSNAQVANHSLGEVGAVGKIVVETRILIGRSKQVDVGIFAILGVYAEVGVDIAHHRVALQAQELDAVESDETAADGCYLVPERSRTSSRLRW